MRCKNDLVMKTIGVDKIKNNQQVDFSVLDNLPDCRNINAGRPVRGEGVYARLDIPSNQLECMNDACVNTGTFYNKGTETVYEVPFDPKEFASGVVTFYVTGADSGTVDFKISDTSEFTNADVYQVAMANLDKKDGYKAVIIDLSAAPKSTDGDGWDGGGSSAFISIKVTATDTSKIGISSIKVFDSMEVFQTSNVVKVGCLTTVGSSFDLEAAEATCFSNGGYSDIDSIEQTITGKALTPNFMKLNPLASKGEAVKGWDSDTVEIGIVAGTGKYANYGVAVLPDLSEDECAFITAMISDICDTSEAYMTRLYVPQAVALTDAQYIVMQDGTVLFNTALIGKNVVITYPKEVEIEEWELTDENFGGTRVRMSYTKTLTDGTKYRFVFNNVLVTSFPNEITEEETEFEFTIVILKDETGRFGRVYRILP